MSLLWEPDATAGTRTPAVSPFPLTPGVRWSETQKEPNPSVYLRPSLWRQDLRGGV